MVMTRSFFHTLAHVTTNMLNSGSTSFRTTSKLDGPDYLNTWDPPPFIFRTEEAFWMRRRNGFTNPKKAPCLSLSSSQDCHDLDVREPTQTWGQKNVDLVIRQWAQLSVWTFERISVFCNCADLSAESLHYTDWAIGSWNDYLITRSAALCVLVYKAEHSQGFRALWNRRKEKEQH